MLKVLIRWLAKGTHKGDLMGTKPTGNKISVSSTVIDRIKDGKVIEHWLIVTIQVSYNRLVLFHLLVNPILIIV